MAWLKVLLFPFSLIYGLVVSIRNLMFEWKVLPSRSFDVPVIGIGNLSIGGAGKTPHVEFLLRLLKERRNIAVLSRGYKRKTHGYVVAGTGSSAEEVGDEAAQIKRKFPEVVVAVHEKRAKGIAETLKSFPGTNLVILDDAFQHRYVKPGLNLLLTEYYNPFFKNFVIPSGNLREPKRGVNRADALIVTKTPPVFSSLDRRFFLENLSGYKSGKIYFSTLRYQKPVPLWDAPVAKPAKKFKTIFLLTGIANKEALCEHLKNQCANLYHFKFPDHHQFSLKDLIPLREQFHSTIGQSKAVITTEKDAVRLQKDTFRKFFNGIPVYSLPVEVVFHESDSRQFTQLIEEFLGRFPANTQ